MAEIIVKNLSLTYPLLGSGVRKKFASPWTSGAGLVARDKDKKSRGVLALKDISFHLKDGDRLGIVGPNGAGKSTLLRVLAGIYEPSIGEVEVDGDIATLFNIGLGLQAEATGYRNILLSGLISGKTRKEIVEKIPAIEEFSELGEYLKLPVRTYSNGMAMRLKFSAGTMFSPNILLMDEWLGAGDKKFTLKARKRMEEIVSSAGILVLASHRQRLIQNECNKLLWLESGSMKAFGAVDDILPEFLESMDPEMKKKTNFVYTPKKPKKNLAKPVEDLEPIEDIKAVENIETAQEVKVAVKRPIAKSMPLVAPTEMPKAESGLKRKKRAGGKKRAAGSVNGVAKKKAGGKKKAAKAGIPQKTGRKKKAGGKKKALNPSEINAAIAARAHRKSKPKKSGKKKSRENQR